jgi:hypothetical protein
MSNRISRHPIFTRRFLIRDVRNSQLDNNPSEIDRVFAEMESQPKRSAWLVEQIKGSAPGQLAVEQSTEFKLIINLRRPVELSFLHP